MSAATVAVVPVKELSLAKERLAPLLSPDERRELARAMLRDVLTALVSTPALDRVYVVGVDAEALALAARIGAEVLVEPPGLAGLNIALEWARRTILEAAEQPGALLVTPADVPAIARGDVEAFLSGDSVGPLVRICPAPDGGTNALLVRPSGAIPFHFGLNSAQAHAAAAGERGIAIEPREVSAFKLDLDTPDDVERCLRLRGGRYTSEALLAMGVAERLLRFERR
jgi:2-phospho-L-lactate guanylyltransferase